jgi:hypothetical protein
MSFHKTLTSFSCTAERPKRYTFGIEAQVKTISGQCITKFKFVAFMALSKMRLCTSFARRSWNRIGIQKGLPRILVAPHSLFQIFCDFGGEIDCSPDP